MKIFFAIDFVVADWRHRQLYSSTHIHQSHHFVFVLRQDKTCFPRTQQRTVESLWFFLEIILRNRNQGTPFLLATTVFVFFCRRKKINLSTMYFESEFKYAVIIDLVTTSWSYQNFSNADAIDRQEIIGEWKILINFFCLFFFVFVERWKSLEIPQCDSSFQSD